MKYSSQEKQLRLALFSSTLEKSLDPTNRWYKLANSLPWNEIERIYNKRLRNKHCGGGNKPARMVIGALIIKHKMNLSDEETIQAIRENPYMQYFLGLESFTNNPIFDSSSFVHIRKRIDVDFFNEITLIVMKKEMIKTGSKAAVNDKDDSDQTGTNDDSFIDENDRPHKGSIKIDATCCEAEVKYPTDLEVINDARDLSERLIDKLCIFSRTPKPRTNRKEARSKFLQIIKKRKKSRKLVRKGVKQQLGYLGHNIQSIIKIISTDTTGWYDLLTQKERKWIGTILKVYRQQKEMYDTRVHQCKNRIISVFQPHIRPIVRGKSKAKVEFGAKIGAAVINGYTFIDHFSWEAYNESVDMETHIKNYYERFGFYPAKCYADRIYMNRENRALLKKYHIQAAGKPLGRPPKESPSKDRKSQEIKDMGERNEVEATFGTGKRIYGANNIRAKLSNTAEAWTAACFFVKNVMKFLKRLLFVLIETGQICIEKLYFKINMRFSTLTRIAA